MASDVPSNRAKRSPRTSVRQPPPGTNGGGSISAAQRRWPEYNRVIIIGTATALTGFAIAAVIAEAVTR
jgi:hypothetical protein